MLRRVAFAPTWRPFSWERERREGLERSWDIRATVSAHILQIFSGAFYTNSDRFIKALGLTLLMKVEIRILVIRFRIQADIRNKREQEKALSPSLCGNGRVTEDVFLIQGFDFSRGHSHLIFALYP